STYTPTFTVTPSNTSTYTPTFTVTPSNTSTYTPTFTNTPTFTPTPSCPPNIPPTVVSVAELVCAIEFANSLFGPDTINLAAGGSFTFAIAEGSNTALPTVTDTLTIEGNGATFTRMGGAPSMRYIQSSAPLTIANLTMVGGIAGLSENGGAIFASADLTITDSTFINNLAGSGSGGAIAPQGGMLTIVNSTFTNNSASVRGGAIFADAPTELVRIDGSTFSNGLSAEGGALYTNVPMQINLSSIHSNNATGSGGGVFACTAGTVSIARSALYNNTTSNNGSALYVCAGLGTTVVTNSTFSNNNATVIFNLGTFDLVYSTVYGGTTGISNSNFMRIKNSIIAAADTNCVGAFTFVGTFSDDATCSGALVRTLGELALGTLANNGGSTLTHALGAGSVAINSTDCLDLNSEAVTIDQRGSVRPRPVLTSCDAGAYEDQASFGPMPTLTPTLTNTPLPGIPGCGTMIVNPVTTVAQFRCAIRLANDELYTPGATSFNLQTGATFDFVDANGGVGNVALPDITSDITINGANATLQRNLIIGDLRLFYVPGGHLRLNDMTLRNANVSGDGGALMALGALTLNNVSFNNNNSLNGGAIYINSGVLTVTGGTFSDNSASTGGAIAVRGSTGSTLVGVTLDTNTAQRGGGLFVGNASIAVANSQIINNDALGGASQGGGVYVEDGGSLSIETTLIRNNLAGQSGGAIYSEGDMLLFATTVDANVSNNFGGNIHTCSGTGDQTQITASTISNANDDFGGIGVQTCNNDTTLITNSTISSNGTGVAHTGGASLNIRFSTLADNGTGISSTGSVNLHSALIAGNSNNCFGTIVATGTNVSSDSSCGSGPSMQFVSIGTILLGPLQNNGGTTLTHYLADASAIRNLIIPANCTILGSPLTRDQRGVTRPAGAGCEPGSTENNTAGGGGGADVPFLEGIATETPTPTMTPTASATPTDAPTEVPASNATATLFDPELVPIFTEVPTETPEVTAEAPTEVPTVTTGGSPTPSATLDLSTTAPTMTASATHDGSGETTAEAPTPAPEPTSTLAPVARALNFTAWMVRR
ncbi:MAG: choice-of-anchor Q domain-containing protein, partial [Chloroflexota bacterium]|nr:choice-of-anchor Q domain-containing protein [Chloroflexota bacterium]